MFLKTKFQTFVAEEEEAGVTIELKRLSNFLANEQLSPLKVVCGMNDI